MKTKRLVALLLCATLCMSALTPVASAAAPTTVVPPKIAYATNKDAFVKSITLSQTTPWSLKIDSIVSNTSNVYTVLLRYDLFNANYNDDGRIGTITSGTYATLPPGLGNPNYYHHALNHDKKGGTQSLNLFNGSLYNFTQDGNYKVSETSGEYSMKYALIVFDGATSVSKLEDYTIATFRMDSEGKLQHESYMVRYMTNNGSAGANIAAAAGLPGNQIEGWTTDSAVSAAVPSRKGYEFMGWGSETQKGVMGVEPNAAAEKTPTAVEVDFLKDGGKNLAWSKVSGASPGFGTTTFNAEKDQFYNLYAIWKPYRATFTNAAETLKTGEDVLQVNVPFEQKYTLKTPSSADTTKTYAVTSSAKLPAGLSVSADGNLGWKIAGTPTAYTTTDAVVTITVTDSINKTTNTVTLTVPPIMKGAQSTPDLDAGTGLASAMVDDSNPDTPDGQLIGFYSAGQTPKKDDANTPMTDGTGTYTNYYLTKGMVYEYRPKTEADGAWREVPAPKALYGDLTGEPGLAFLASLDKGATTRYKTAITGKTAATYAVQAPGAAWDAAYGAIQFVDGLPVVTALAKDATYEVRFRENDTYAASVPALLKVGGTAAGGSGPAGFALVFNFAGGTVTEVEAPQFAAQEGLADATEVTLPTAVPTRENCTFDGWVDSHEGTLHQPGAEVTIAGGSLALSAKWTATTAGFVSVTFYDWDETTVLGSIVVPKGRDATADVAAFIKTLTAPASKDYPESAGEAYFVDDAGFPLSYKRGYSFHGWLPFDSDLYTSCGRAMNGAGDPITVAPPRLTATEEGAQETQDLTALTESLIVKACYQDNTELYYNTADITTMYYTLTQSYTRLGTSQTFAILAKMERYAMVEGAKRGVPRLLDPQFRAIYTVAGNAVYNFFGVENRDVMEFTVYPSNKVDTAKSVLVDFYEAGVKTAATAKANEESINYAKEGDVLGFQQLGNVGLINEQLAADETTYLTNLVVRNGAGLTLSKGGINVDRVSMRTAWLTKNTVAGDGITLKPPHQQVGLTWAEMQHAIDNKGQLAP